MKMRTISGARPWLGRLAAMALGTSLVIAATMTLSPHVVAQDDGSSRKCSLSTLRGDYGLLASGVRRLPPPLGSGTERFAATAVWTFHGDGTFTQGPGGALKGETTGLAPAINEIPGTYQVNENCTGSLALFAPELPVPVQYSIVIVDNARQVKAIVTNPGLATVELTRK
jgi:hypothetical protein